MFSVRDDEPFVIFQILQEIVRKERAQSDIIDLSRGDPGYGFTPSVRGRECASFVLFLDSILNANAGERFGRWEESTSKELWKEIEEKTKTHFHPSTGDHLLGLLREFVAEAVTSAKGEGKNWSEFTVLSALFTHSAMSGGSYLHPRGEALSRIITASWHRKELGVPVQSDDLLLTNGASHAIGSLFKALGTEGCGFLQEGDAVCIASPVYAPYNQLLKERGLHVLTLSIDPLTGKIAEEDVRALKETKAHVKALFLIDPHNPTGFSLSERELTLLATIAKERNLLIITDEVYSSFFPRKKTMLVLAPERTMCINARSKIERSTGLRFGEIIVLPEGRKHLAALLGLPDAEGLWKLLLRAKSPGRAGGQFQHTTFVPGPAQLLGIAHIVLGGEERKTYLKNVEENRRTFLKTLSLPHQGNTYYVIFDLDTLPECKTQHLPMEERLLRLAKAGVIYLPAYRFFAEKDRSRPGALTSVRASIVNTSAEKLKEAGRRTREVLC